MDPQSGARAQIEFERAQHELDQGNVLVALASLEKALAIRDDPNWHSRLAYCIAKERGHLTRAFDLCRTAIAHDPDNPLHYYYLGKVHLIAGHTYEALQVLRQGMAHGGSPDIERELVSIGTRKPPVLPSLSRNNPLNKYLGILLSRLKLR
jgi:tetratricopeptide (TPR) repeat protein